MNLYNSSRKSYEGCFLFLFQESNKFTPFIYSLCSNICDKPNIPNCRKIDFFRISNGKNISLF